ncbi:hypothetical protein [Oerskovia enterophila]|uniref:hypothetical protein n=1 Tax=Oerskovia enterophila TaxID=43678 RepID=UPI0037F632C2
MSAATETDILAGLDWNPVWACEHSDHPKWPGNPAATWIKYSKCPACDHGPQVLLVCNPDRLDFMKARVIVCNSCAHEGPPQAFKLTFRPIGDMP